jgi:hypothetical protein
MMKGSVQEGLVGSLHYHASFIIFVEGCYLKISS